MAEHWNDILRVLQSDGKPRFLGKAISELGKLPKTVHLLKYRGDGAYRRAIGGQFNLHKQRHSPAPGCAMVKNRQRDWDRCSFRSASIR